MAGLVARLGSSAVTACRRALLPGAELQRRSPQRQRAHHRLRQGRLRLMSRRQPCTRDTQCYSAGCNSECCQPEPACDDSEQNGGETGLDCGGGICDPCPDLQSCTQRSDCQIPNSHHSTQTARSRQPTSNAHATTKQ